MTLSTFIVSSMLVIGLGGMVAAADEPPTSSLPSPPASIDHEPSTSHAASYRISVMPTAGESGEIRFAIPAGDYTKVVISQGDHRQYRFVGEYETRIQAPSGADKAFMTAKGGGYTSPVGGSAYVGSSLGVSKQLPYEPGTWRISYDVQGSLELGFDVMVS